MLNSLSSASIYQPDKSVHHVGLIKTGLISSIDIVKPILNSPYIILTGHFI